MGTIDMSAATAPPKRRTPNTRAAKVQSAPVPEATISKADFREQGMNGLAQLGMGLLSIAGLYADAATVGQFWPPISHELAKLADTNDTIAKPIDIAINVGPYGAFLGAVMPFAFQIAANHGWIDASRMAGHGVVPPAVMEARAKAQMLQMAADAQKQQNEALAQQRKAEEDYATAVREQQMEAQRAAA